MNLFINKGLRGGNFILSDCVLYGNNVSDGIIVINGEIIPFDGSTKKDKITIVETSHNPANNNIFNKLSARTAYISDLSTHGSVEQDTADKEYNVNNMTNQNWDNPTIKDIANDEPHENHPP